MDGLGEQLLAGAGFTFDQNRDIAQSGQPRLGDDLFHGVAAMNDAAEFATLGQLSVGKSGQQAPVGPFDKIGKEFGVDIKGHCHPLNALFSGRLQQLRVRKWPLGEHDPHRRHGRGAGAEVKYRNGTAPGAL